MKSGLDNLLVLRIGCRVVGVVRIGEKSFLSQFILRIRHFSHRHHWESHLFCPRAHNVSENVDDGELNLNRKSVKKLKMEREISKR